MSSVTAKRPFPNAVDSQSLQKASLMFMQVFWLDVDSSYAQVMGAGGNGWIAKNYEAT